MIEAKNVLKRFADLTAVDHINATVENGAIFGLIGSNGAGKSTFLRMLAGVLAPDEGEILIDGQQVYENVACKQRCFFISDEQFYFPNTTPLSLKNYYASYYERFDHTRWEKLMAGFGLDPNRKINTFSKGMRRQVSMLYGLCAGTDYLFCDETFDGLDTMVRQTVKGLLADDVATRGLTPILASHNLRELEDICDKIGLLHRGGILLSCDLEQMKSEIFKLQAVFQPALSEDALRGLDIVKIEQRGSLYTITARGARAALVQKIEALSPTFYEVLPLSLEEIFISETEVAGYDIKKCLLDQ